MKLKIYGSLKEAVNLGLIRLPNDPDLLDELKALQIRNGVDIAAPKSGRITHDDRADCIALLCDGLGSDEYNRSSGFIEDFEGYCYEHQYWNRKPHPEGVDYNNCPHRESGCFACEKEQEADGSLAAQEQLDGQLSRLAMENPPDREFDVFLDTDVGQRLMEREKTAEEARWPVIEMFYRSIRNSRQKEKIK
jgi:hypothetical protein